MSPQESKIPECQIPKSPAELTKKPHTQPATTQNTISIDLGSCNLQTKEQETVEAREISLSPNPLEINLSTDTDWATVLVGSFGILSSMVIAYYSHKNQQNQVRSNIANLRNQWINDLRNISSEFAEQVVFLTAKLEKNQSYLKSDESTLKYGSLLYSQIKISLMLDRSHKINKETIKITEELIHEIKLLQENKDDKGKIGFLASKFETNISVILENAWQDIKYDLGHKSFFGFPLHRRKIHQKSSE